MQKGKTISVEGLNGRYFFHNFDDGTHVVHFVGPVLLLWSPGGVYVMIVVYHQQNCELLVDGFLNGSIAHLEVLLGNGRMVSRNDLT